MNSLLASGGGGTRALEKWAKVVTSIHLAAHPAGPQAIMNMTTSWRNGLGFCAIIHHFRPELLSAEELAARDPEDVYGNNELAFNLAEQQLGIPALLDPQDMVECELLDRLSILTYLAQFYQAFHGSVNPGTMDGRKGAAKRTTSSASNSSNSSPLRTPSKAPIMGRMNEPCRVCKKDVKILARLNVAGKILHRQCFRCARCQSQLSIANYYETEKEGTYCCEMCPDEEQIRETEVALTKMTLERNQKLVGSNSDADEEGSSSENDEKETGSRISDTEPLGLKKDLEDKNSLPESQQDTEDKLVVTISTDDPDGSISTNATIHIETISQDAKTIEDDIKEESKDNQEDKISEKDAQNNNNSENLQKEDKSVDKDDNNAPMLQPECDQIETKMEERTQEENPFEDDDKEDNEQTTLKTDENKEHLDNPESDEAISNCQKQPKEDDNGELVPAIDVKVEDEDSAIIVDNTVTSITEGVSPSLEANADVKEEETTSHQDEVSYPTDMNPFGDDDEDEEEEKPATTINGKSVESESNETQVSPKAPKKESTNPFGSDFEESEEDAVGELKTVSSLGAPLNGPPKPPRTPSVRQSLNPFGSDFEDDEEESNSSTNHVIVTPDSRASHTYSNVTLRSPPSPSLSTTSRISSFSTNKRKKRPAPPPPPSNVGAKPSPIARTAVSPTPSPRSSIKPQNASPIPAPRASKLVNTTSPAGSTHRPPPRPPPPSSIVGSSSGDLPKSRKDKDNLNRRSQCLMQMNQATGDTSSSYTSVVNSSNIGSAGTSDVDSSSIMSGSITSNSASTRSASISAITPSSSSITGSATGPSIVVTPLSPDKASTEGQWKKKKGPAPPRPIPPKRQVKKIPRKAVNQELKDIELKQIELEKQGDILEEQIRELMLKSDAEREEAGLEISNDRDSLGPEVEDAIIQLFDLVNEKNDLFRRQTLLLYMKREQKLEEEHATLEHQIRVSMAKPDALKTSEDKEHEDKLISRLVSVVTQRNEVVDCLEMDRLRALEEDESIETHMEEYAAIKPPEDADEKTSKKKKKKKEKKKKKKDKSYDADKDVDTKEFPNAGASEASSANGTPKSSPAKFKPFGNASLTPSPLSIDKEKTKKLKKKILSSLKPVPSSNKKSENSEKK